MAHIQLFASLLLHAKCTSRSEIPILAVAPVLLLRLHAVILEVLVLRLRMVSEKAEQLEG